MPTSSIVILALSACKRTAEINRLSRSRRGSPMIRTPMGAFAICLDRKREMRGPATPMIAELITRA
jgi:hypothetical protein